METLTDIRVATKETLAAVIGPPQPVALIDFPWHWNAGDSLIYLGEWAYLQQLGYRVRYIADQRRYDPARLRSAHPDGPILLHGGGNFGDRYSTFQPYRERVVGEFPDRKIVQLPQSIEYLDESLATATRGALRGHPDFTLLLREDPSMKLAASLFEGVRTTFCHDLAFGAHQPDLHGRQPDYEVVWLLRKDSEGVPRQLEIGPQDCVADWELRRADRAYWNVWAFPERLAQRAPLVRPVTDPLRRRSYLNLARVNVIRAARTLRAGRIVVTDRLHAAVLGGLMGMPVIALDNNYGKVSSVYASTLNVLPTVTFAGSEDEVAGALAELRDGSAAPRR